MALRDDQILDLLDHFFRTDIVRNQDPSPLKPCSLFIDNIIGFYIHYWKGQQLPSINNIGLSTKQIALLEELWVNAAN